ncbi:MAG TPA: hypothetical protein VKU39_12315 [Streptosporangiaceae bacterium]|nr:hypothetical protein [Streptosporangiaceae bacterium]
MTHPEMTRMLIAEQQRDMLARADQRRKVRFAKRQRKVNDDAVAAAEELLVARVPDYVDGSFRENAPEATSAAPAARSAA